MFLTLFVLRMTHSMCIASPIPGHAVLSFAERTDH
jgi:hypothetical protein